jgi:hypothetical protein
MKQLIDIMEEGANKFEEKWHMPKCVCLTDNSMWKLIDETE